MKPIFKKSEINKKSSNMKRITITLLFTLLTTTILMAQPIIPNTHGLQTHQPAWNQDIAQTQEYSLNNGFAWWSSYIDLSDNGLSKLENALNLDASMIKNATSFVSLDNDNVWTGTLQELSNSQMYLLLISSESTTFQLEGNPVSPENVAIEISNGWNWIGYPVSEATDLSVALANYNAQHNDLIKSQKFFSTYSASDHQWTGTLNQLTPGEGYILLSNGEESTFHYATGSKSAVVEDTPTTFWNANYKDFALNMNLIATIQLNGEVLRGEDFELGAFYGDECRGTTPIQYVKSTDSYTAFLTIAGNGGENIEFRLLDRTTGAVYSEEHNMRIVYNDNTVVGSLDSPCALSFKNTLSQEEALAGMITMYPNPLQHNDNLRLALPEQLSNNTSLTIQVVDMLGQVVKETTMTDNTCSLNCDMTPGLYLVKVFSNDALILNNKLIVK